MEVVLKIHQRFVALATDYVNCRLVKYNIILVWYTALLRLVQLINRNTQKGIPYLAPHGRYMHQYIILYIIVKKEIQFPNYLVLDDQNLNLNLQMSGQITLREVERAMATLAALWLKSICLICVTKWKHFWHYSKIYVEIRYRWY